MSASTIKIIALIFMLIDHFGMFFFPQVFAFRIIGRLSFPLFAWTIANGAHHTKNSAHYFFRLVLFAAISQIPYVLSIRQLAPGFNGLNVFFTLSIGLLTIMFVRQIKDTFYRLLLTFLMALIAQLINADYGAYGILVIMIFYFFYHDWRKMLIAQIFLMGLVSLISYYYANMLGMFRVFGILSVLLLLLYNDKKGKSLKYFFYIVYPLQFILFYFMLEALK